MHNDSGAANMANYNLDLVTRIAGIVILIAASVLGQGQLQKADL